MNNFFISLSATLVYGPRKYRTQLVNSDIQCVDCLYLVCMCNVDWEPFGLSFFWHYAYNVLASIRYTLNIIASFMRCLLFGGGKVYIATFANDDAHDHNMIIMCGVARWAIICHRFHLASHYWALSQGIHAESVKKLESCRPPFTSTNVLWPLLKV